MKNKEITYTSIVKVNKGFWKGYTDNVSSYYFIGHDTKYLLKGSCNEFHCAEDLDVLDIPWYNFWACWW